MRRRQFVTLCARALALLGLSGCVAARPARSQLAAPSGQQEIALPPPHSQGESSLEAVLSRRRSVREYVAQALSLAEIGQLFWAGQGMTASWGGRTVPSAGATYPLEMYAATPEGCYHYLSRGHKVELLAESDLREALYEAGLWQGSIRSAAAVFVIVAIYERTAGRYGDRARQYVHLEAGHAAQNLLLQAVALGLGAVPIGAFYDDKVQAALALPADYKPLYLIPVGRPRA